MQGEKENRQANSPSLLANSPALLANEVKEAQKGNSKVVIEEKGNKG